MPWLVLTKTMASIPFHALIHVVTLRYTQSGGQVDVLCEGNTVTELEAELVVFSTLYNCTLVHRRTAFLASQVVILWHKHTWMIFLLYTLFHLVVAESHNFL